MYKILLVDDEHLSRDMLATYVEGLLGYKVIQARSGEEAFEIFSNEDFPIVLSDIKMPGMNGLDLLKAIKASAKGKQTRVILFTGFAQVETAVQALRDGAYDYLFKPIDVNRLGELIRQIQSEIENSPETSAPSGEPGTPAAKLKNGSYIELPNLGKVGIFSNKMKNIVTVANKLHEDRTLSVLIEGESGTGKEIIASLIHYGAECSPKPLVMLNCSAIAPNLFESELFGYEGGTFTGGFDGGKKGKLELAQGGTLVLDEIGDMPLEMQPKLLRVLQERCFYRVGGNEKIDLDVRFISSTNKDLKKMVSEDKFRHDLYYRINSASIQIPPLSGQKEAIAPLSQMFLIEASQKRNKKFRLISKSAVELLESYPWHGNIRELKNTIDRIVLLYDEIEVRPEHLNFMEFADKGSLNDRLTILKPGAFSLPEDTFNIDDLEHEIVQMALDKFGGNKSQTAKYLGITPSALRSRLK